ncbi:MAG: LamG domain-containing protein [Gemmatimonadales bacterium]
MKRLALAGLLAALLPFGAPEPGLVLHYDFEGTDPTRILDRSGHGHDGTAAGGTAVPGPTGAARLFRTVADRIHFAEHPDFALDGPLTVATILRVDSLGLHQHVIACDDKWAFWITPDNRFRLADTKGGGVSTEPGSVPKGRWTSVVAVWRGTAGDSIDTGHLTIYVDGVPATASSHLRTAAAQTAATWSPGELHPSDACYVGFESHQGNAVHQSMPFVGAIDDLRVYSRALSAEEAAAIGVSRR